jgi:hypothetical protein
MLKPFFSKKQLNTGKVSPLILYKLVFVGARHDALRYTPRNVYEHVFIVFQIVHDVS